MVTVRIGSLRKKVNLNNYASDRNYSHVLHLPSETPLSELGFSLLSVPGMSPPFTGRQSEFPDMLCSSIDIKPVSSFKF